MTVASQSPSIPPAAACRCRRPPRRAGCGRLRARAHRAGLPDLFRRDLRWRRSAVRRDRPLGGGNDREPSAHDPSVSGVSRWLQDVVAGADRHERVGLVEFDTCRIATLGDDLHLLLELAPHHRHAPIARRQPFLGVQRDRTWPVWASIVAGEPLVLLLAQLEPRAVAVVDRQTLRRTGPCACAPSRTRGCACRRSAVPTTCCSSCRARSASES